MVEEVKGEKEEIVEIEDQDHVIDQVHMTDQVHMIGQKAERSSSRDRNSRSRSKNQNSREKRNNSGTRYSPGLFCDHCKMTNHDIFHCYKLQKTLKKKGISLNETNKKDKDDQEGYKMFMDLKSYIDAKDPTN